MCIDIRCADVLSCCHASAVSANCAGASATHDAPLLPLASAAECCSCVLREQFFCQRCYMLPLCDLWFDGPPAPPTGFEGVIYGGFVSGWPPQAAKTCRDCMCLSSL